MYADNQLVRGSAIQRSWYWNQTFATTSYSFKEAWKKQDSADIFNDTGSSGTFFVEFGF